MDEFYELNRFVDAQEPIFGDVIGELKKGTKQSHWMWFVFPQLAGLGHSSTARYYAISSLGEARAYLAHPVLGPRLRQSLRTLLGWAGTRSAEEILGSVDSLKLRSSLTLFDVVEPGGPFREGLAAFYSDENDQRTLALLNGQA